MFCDPVQEDLKAHYSNRGYGNGFGQGGGHSQPVQVSLKTGSKLFVSNLDEGVTSEDVEVNTLPVPYARMSLFTS